LRVAAVARALGVDRGTIHERLRRYDEAGTAGLIQGKGKRKPTKIVGGVEQRLLELSRQGAGPREIARRLGLSLGGVTGALIPLHIHLRGKEGV
jgi:transposase